MFSRRPYRSRRSGLGLLVVASAVAGALLIVNRLVIASLYRGPGTVRRG